MSRGQTGEHLSREDKTQRWCIPGKDRRKAIWELAGEYHQGPSKGSRQRVKSLDKESGPQWQRQSEESTGFRVAQTQVSIQGQLFICCVNLDRPLNLSEPPFP